MDFDSVVNDYVNGMSGPKIAKKYSIHVGTVYNIVRRSGSSVRSNSVNSRRYKINHDYFESIDDQNKAYWLGLLAADGHVIRNQVIITQKDPDHEYLKIFAKDMNSDYEVKMYDGKTSYGNCRYGKLVVTSSKMNSDLKKLGIIERKSLDLKPPPIDSSMFPSYIRGYFDGDGSASLGSHLPRIRFCGTEEMLEWISVQLNANKIFWSKRYDDEKNNYMIEISRKADLITSTDYMYNDATRYYDRKYKRLVQFHSRPIQ